MRKIILKSIGRKHNYEAFQADGLRGTVLFPSTYFADSPGDMEVESTFVAPRVAPPKVDELLAQIELLKSQLADKNDK